MVNSPLDMSKYQRDVPRKISWDRQEFEQWFSTTGYFGPMRYLAVSGNISICMCVCVLHLGVATDV